MKKITVLVGFEATEETINSLSTGTMVELKREPANTADPNAIQVFLDGALVGYVAADPKKTVLKGTSSNAVVAKNMDKPSVAGCYAKLLNAQPYGDDNKRMRWEAELYWVPVWEDKPKESEEGPLILKVGAPASAMGRSAPSWKTSMPSRAASWSPECSRRAKRASSSPRFGLLARCLPAMPVLPVRSRTLRLS